MFDWELVDSVSSNGIRIDLLTKRVSENGDYDAPAPDLSVVARVIYGEKDLSCSTFEDLLNCLAKLCDDVVVFVSHVPLFFARTVSVMKKGTRPITPHSLYHTLITEKKMNLAELLPHVDGEGILRWSTMAFENGTTVVQWEEYSLPKGGIKEGYDLRHAP